MVHPKKKTIAVPPPQKKKDTEIIIWAKVRGEATTNLDEEQSIAESWSNMNDPLNADYSVINFPKPIFSRHPFETLVFGKLWNVLLG